MLIGIDASRTSIDRPTGTEVYSQRLIEALLAHEASHRYRLYFRSLPSGSAFSGAELCAIPFPRLWTHIRLSWEMAHHPPDVLFVPAHVLPLIHPRASIVTIHDLGYLHFPTAHPWRQRIYLHLSTRWNARVSAHVLADSKATKADLINRYGTSPDKITVAYPGRDETLSPTRDLAEIEAVKARYGITGDYFLYVGTLQPRKNLAHLISAFAALRSKLEYGSRARKISLVLAGKRGWLYNDLFRQIRQLDLEGAVLLPGYVSEEHKGALMSGAVAFVFPTLYEGFGLPVLEAQGCGCPVITSTTSSLPEVAGGAALLVNPLDSDAIAKAMQQVVTDQTLRTNLIEGGFANIRRFSWTACAEIVLNVAEQSRQSMV